MWKWKYNGFSLSHDPARSRDQRVVSFYGWESLMVSKHLV